MRKVTGLFLFVFMLAFATAGWAQDEYTTKALQEQLSKEDSLDARVAIYKDFLKNAKDVDVLRMAQESWRQDDTAGVWDYFEKAYKAHPKSAKYSYLFGRLQKTDITKIDFGRKTIALDPKFEYGYRLLLVTYDPVLKGSGASKDALEKLKTEFVKDTAKYAEWAKLAPHSEMAQMMLYNYLTYSKQYSEAEKLVDRGKALKWSWSTDKELAHLYALQGQYLNSLNSIKEYVQGNSYFAKSSKDEKEQAVDQLYVQELTAANANEQIIKYLSDVPNFEQKTDYLLQAAFAAARINNLDKAFTLFGKIADAGGVRMTELEADEMVEVKKDSRWAATEANLKAAWDKSAEKRRAKVVADKVNEPAPDWELATPQGNKVKLSSLKGQVVILDFWATWCGPCRSAMPVISAYTAKKPAGVRVFSVDVWEKADAKAAAFMKDNNYKMELLYGTDETAKAYNLSGIPTLVVIDKKGNIQYKEVGYSEELSEKLSWWVDELLK